MGNPVEAKPTQPTADVVIAARSIGVAESYL
jgi:hypothetical protein